MKSMFDDFKKFIMKGNVLDLAVAVIIGAAFGAVVVSFTNDIIMPIVGAVFGKPSFNDVTLTIGDGVIYYGKFITVLINFVIIAFVIFLIVKAFEKMQSMRGATKDADGPSDNDLLTEIRDLLKQRSA
jgi:large conductance mechanosensitive channel